MGFDDLEAVYNPHVFAYSLNYEPVRGMNKFMISTYKGKFYHYLPTIGASKPELDTIEKLFACMAGFYCVQGRAVQANELKRVMEYPS